MLGRWGTSATTWHLLSVIAVYAVCAVAVLVRSTQGTPLVFVGGPSTGGLGRAVFLIFGNGDPAVGKYLFGRCSHVFSGFGWCELGLAMTGNVALFVGWFTQTPRRKPSHLFVRGLIFAIIQTEWLGRLQLVSWATGFHTFLGLTLVLVVPYSYLAHLYLVPLVFASAWRRYRLGSTA